MATAPKQNFRGTQRFRIEECLGFGTSGVVYRAFDRERGVHVALKTLQRLDGANLYQFKQEFRNLTDVTHPNLVALYELISTGDHWFFTMEYVSGVDFIRYVRPDMIGEVRPSKLTDLAKTLSSVEQAVTVEIDFWRAATQDHAAVTDVGHLDERRLRESLRQLADGVSALHWAGRLHRDIKPTNVLATDSGRVVLLDFGLVTDLQKRTDLTSELVGTAWYMSPEQGLSQSLTEASDWYAVGCILFEALTGHVPFEGRDVFRVIKDKTDATSPPSLEEYDNVPPDLKELCYDLLLRDASQRPTGVEILKRLHSHEAYRLETARRPRHDTRFVGRQRQIARLFAAFEVARLGRSVAAFIKGPAGVGKTALVQHFVDELEREYDALVLTGRCFERESVPFKALDDLIDALSRHLLSLPRSELTAILPEDMGSLGRVFPVLRRLAQGPPSGETPDLQELRRRAAISLRTLLHRLSIRQPVVLFIDDLHWGDADSAAFLEELLRPPDAPPLLLLGCFRSGEDTGPVYGQLARTRVDTDLVPDIRRLELEPLTHAESVTLVRMILEEGGDDASKREQKAESARRQASDIIRLLSDAPRDVVEPIERLANAIITEAEGSPLYVTELAHHVRRKGLAQVEGASIQLDDVLRSRVKELDHNSRQLLEVIALAGRPIRQSTARLAATLEGDPLTAFHSLRAKHFINTHGGRGDDFVEIYHDRLRDIVLASLDASDNAAHHAGLAHALERSGNSDTEEMLEHYLGAGDFSAATRCAERSANSAAEALAFSKAAELYKLALDLRPKNEAEAPAELLAAYARTLTNCGRGTSAADVFLQAAQKTDSEERALEYRHSAGSQLLRAGHLDRGLAILESVLRAYGVRMATKPIAAVLRYLWLRLRVKLRGYRFRAVEESACAPELLERIDVCESGALGLGMVDTVRGAELQLRHLLLALRAGEVNRISRAFAIEAVFDGTRGYRARQRARKLAVRAHDLATSRNFPEGLGMSLLALGYIEFFAGRWAKARDYFIETERVLRDRCTNVSWEVNNARIFHSGALFFLGDLAQLCKWIPKLVQEQADRGDLYATTGLRADVPNVIWLVADQPFRARQEIEEVMAHWAPDRFLVQHYWRLLAEGRIDLYEGKGTEGYQRLLEVWPRLKHSQLLRVQVVRVFSLNMRARLALAAAIANPSDPDFAKDAMVTNRRLRKENARFVAPLCDLVDAGLSVIAGDMEAAEGLLRDAISGFEAVEMSVFAAAARHRLGEVKSDRAGDEQIRQAERLMQAQTVRRPTRFTDMLAPFPAL